jgi:ComF family protein
MTTVLAPLRHLLDFALPPRCAGCGIIVREGRTICQDCWGSLTFLTGKGCLRCGVPMEVEGLVCGPCLAAPPHHDGARAAVRYGGVASDIAVRLKHGRRIGLAKLMARAMARHVPQRPVLLVPIPLHRWRLWSRGFNQSLLVARELRHLSGQSLHMDLIKRVKATPMLGGLGAKERAQTMRGVFKVPPSARPIVRDAEILLIDDVYTSGATANAAALALKRAGAARVSILSWARVIKES